MCPKQIASLTSLKRTCLTAFTFTWLMSGCQQNELLPPTENSVLVSVRSARVANGLVAYWKLDGNAQDALGIRNGTVVNGTFEAGIAGQALRLGGSTYVELPKNILSSGSGTVSLWVKTTQTSGILFYGARQGGNGFGSQDELHLHLQDGKPALFIEGTGDTTTDFALTASQAVNDGQWHHVAATWANSSVTGGSNETLLWVDGEIAVSEGDFEDGKNFNNAKAFTFSAYIRLGSPAAAERTFTGLLDDVQIYNRPLDGTEVEIVYRTAGDKPLEYVVDNTSPTFSTVVDFSVGGQPADIWSVSSAIPGFLGTNYLHDGNVGANPEKHATWYSPVQRAGAYKVYMRWVSAPDRPDAAPVEIKHQGGLTQLTMNQRLNSGKWVKLGSWNFDKIDETDFFFNSPGYVRLSAADAGYTIADAVKFVEVK